MNIEIINKIMVLNSTYIVPLSTRWVYTKFRFYTGFSGSRNSMCKLLSSAPIRSKINREMAKSVQNKENIDRKAVSPSNFFEAEIIKYEGKDCVFGNKKE